MHPFEFYVDSEIELKFLFSTMTDKVLQYESVSVMLMSVSYCADTLDLVKYAELRACEIV